MVQVKVSEGILEGEILNNVLGGKYYSFKGIPYAAPPVADLRFKAPQPPKPWCGVRSAKEHGPICCQIDVVTKTEIKGEEDCLYLNVYSPDIRTTEPLPVMVYIHGGGFVSGSGDSNMWGPDFLIKQNVILVTINYRLEVLGFLCLNTKDIPGNAGIKDQVAALRWVKKNICNFGGDPDNVTIFGASAGGVSVSFHLVSPMTKGLFKRAIVQSGCNLSQAANSFEPRLLAESIAQSLGFHSSDDKELYDFFKTAPVEKLLGIQTPVITDEAAGVHLALKFGIADEKQFDNEERYIYGNIYEIIRHGIHEDVEVVIGYTTQEGTVICSMLDNILDKSNKYLQTFLPLHMILECSVKSQLEIARKMKRHYFGNKRSITVKDGYRLLDFFTAQIFAYDSMQLINTVSKKNKCYLYKFDCYSERNIFTKLFNADFLTEGKRAVSHYDDTTYLFNMADIPFDLNSKSYKMIQNTTSLWANFAKTGNPTPNNSLGAIWKTYNCTTQEYLHIGDELIPKSYADKKDIEFWDDLYKQYLPNKHL